MQRLDRFVDHGGLELLAREDVPEDHRLVPRGGEQEAVVEDAETRHAVEMALQLRHQLVLLALVQVPDADDEVVAAGDGVERVLRLGEHGQVDDAKGVAEVVCAVCLFNVPHLGGVVGAACD